MTVCNVEQGNLIEVANVCKEFKTLKVDTEGRGRFKSLLNREYIIKKAVDDISFEIAKGEMVGYIGPNGAGKSTMIKMLCGILTPDSGEIRVKDRIPYLDRKNNAKHIGVVFGQRSSLYWDLPLTDTFELHKKIYDIPDQIFRDNEEWLFDIFEMGSFLHQPVRQLSLGQKMKANIALSMLHNPKVLYLDEPTIGLDVVAKKTLREAILKLNKEKQTTIILTTHDMDDIEEICNRIILINDGMKLFDGELDDFKDKYKEGFTIWLSFDQVPGWIDHPDFKLTAQTDKQWVIHVRDGINSRKAMQSLLELYNPENIQIKDQEIEEIIRKIFNSANGNA